MRHAVLIAAVSLAAAAATAFAADNVLHPQAPAGAKVFFVDLQDGATIGQEARVNFGVSGIALAPATDTAPNTGHHHLLIDANEPPPPGVPIPKDATHLHYGQAQTQDVLHLAPGDHTLQLVFANAAHVPFEPSIQSKKITVHVQ